MRNDIRHINQKELVTGKLSQSSSTSTPFTLSNYYNVAVGISHTPSGKELGTDFGWFLASTAKTRDIHVGGVYQTNLNSPRLFQNGDVYRIWRNNGNVEFYVNGLLDGTFTDKYPDRPMYLEVSFFDPNKKVENLYIYKEVLKTHDTITSTKMVAVNGGYRYGFNSMEKDDEVKGRGNSYDFGARMYDSRLGRWLTIDAFAGKYPALNPYNFGANNPLFFVDSDGKDIDPGNIGESPYGIIFNQLFATNSVYRKALSKYMNNSMYNFTLFYDGSKVKQNANATTYASPHVNTSSHTLIGMKTDSYYDPNRTHFEIEDNTDAFIISYYSLVKSDIALVNTLLHEAIHGYIAVTKFGSKDDENHDLFSNYQKMMYEGLKEYRDLNNLGYSNEQLTQLSWSGVSNSKAFKKYIKDLSIDKGTEYDEELKNWKHSVNQIQWKIKEKKTVIIPKPE